MMITMEVPKISNYHSTIDCHDSLQPNMKAPNDIENKRVFALLAQLRHCGSENQFYQKNSADFHQTKYFAILGLCL